MPKYLRDNVFCQVPNPTRRRNARAISPTVRQDQERNRGQAVPHLDDVLLDDVIVVDQLLETVLAGIRADEGNRSV